MLATAVFCSKVTLWAECSSLELTFLDIATCWVSPLPVTLFVPFLLFNWLMFSSIHSSLSILHISGMLAHSWPGESWIFPLWGSSFGLEVWVVLHAPCLHQKYYLELGHLNRTDQWSLYISFLFVYSEVFWSGKPLFQPGFPEVSTEVQGREEQFRKSTGRAQKKLWMPVPELWLQHMGLTLKVHLSCTSVHPPSVHDCVQYGRTRCATNNLESLTVWALLWNMLLH